MNFILSLVIQSVSKVILTLQHNWPFLLLSVLIAALLKVFIDAEKVSAFLRRFRGAGVLAATAAAVTTPLCSCGTTAVVLGMMASMMPWAPVVAFMVSSPLTSPGELVFSAGLFGWPFALAFFLSSILLGLGSGWLAGILENRGWLANQTRFSASTAASKCACSSANQTRPILAPVTANPTLDLSNLVLSAAGSGCGCAQPAPVVACACAAPAQARSTNFSVSGLLNHPKAAILAKEMGNSGIRLLAMFVGFAFVGYFLNGLIPSSWMAALFGNGHIYSVPLAATLGLPFYVNTEASLPLIRALLDAGMSQGAVMAFMISGAGTSLGAIAGALTIARWRVVALVVTVLWAGAILSGYAYDLFLALRLF